MILLVSSSLTRKDGSLAPSSYIVEIKGTYVCPKKKRLDFIQSAFRQKVRERKGRSL